jgi:hypothetical protein
MQSTNGTKDGNILPTRQTIIGILLDVMTEGGFGQEDTVYLDMFIARNLPKFPQFIILPGKILDMVLRRLCDYPSDELADDCQLSVEYLLSYYHPSDLESLSPVFRRAGFYRVLKSVYKAGKRYAQLMQVQFDDKNNQESVFDCIGDCLRPGSTLTSKQVREVHSVIVANARGLVAIDTARAAQTLAAHAPQLVQPVFEALDEGSQLQYMFLKSILDPSSLVVSLQLNGDESLHHQFEEKYVRLMCTYEPSRVADYIGLLKSGDLRLKEVLPAMESSGAIDAAVLLLARDGLVEDAMERLKAHMLALQVGLIGLVEAVKDSPGSSNSMEALDAILDAIQKYVKVGIWLCQGQTRIANSKPRQKQRSNIKKLLKNDDPEVNLALDELLWLEFIDAIVNIAKTGSVAEHTSSSEPDQLTVANSKIKVRLRAAVQDCFTALLNATARPLQADSSLPVQATQPHPSFLLILRAFLSRAATSSPSLSDLRAVVAEIFQAYAFEERILDLAHQFLDKDLFVHVEDAWAGRQMGWRPRGNVCEGCGRRVWGPGLGSSIWESWEANMSRVALQKSGQGRSPLTLSEEGDGNGRERGKGKAVGVNEEDAGAELDVIPNVGEQDADAVEGRFDAAVQPLVVFACRHIWHRNCLNGATSSGHGEPRLECPAKH